jgi:hypothetical protein
MPQDDDHAAALEAMASGEHTDPAEQADEMSADDSVETEENPAAALANAGGHPEAIPPVPSAEQKRARQDKIRRAQAKATGTQMKKTMVPLLLVSGVILVVLGGLTGIMNSGGNISDTGVFDSGTILLLTIAAFVLGPILIIGGWVLHMDVKKSDS